MKIDYNAKAEHFILKPESTEEYYTLHLIYDSQCTLSTEQTIQELIKRMFVYTIDGKEVEWEEFSNYYQKLYNLNGGDTKKTYKEAKLFLNSIYGKLATPQRKFIIVHKYDNPKQEAIIFIDQIQAISKRDNGCASVRLRSCNYDTCDKYEKVIMQLT